MPSTSRTGPVTQTVTLVNIGVRPLHFASAAVSRANPADFAADASACAGQTLQVLDGCAIKVTFAPRGASGRRGELDVLTDDPNGANIVDLLGPGSSSGQAGQHSAAAPDRTAPALKLTVGHVRLTSRLRALPVKVRCSEACSANATLTLSSKQARKLHLRSGQTVGAATPGGRRRAR